MDEKTMVNDVLGAVKAELSCYETAIEESENIKLRETFQQQRDDLETYQYNLFKLAETNGYYKPARPADMAEIQTLKNELSKG